MYGMLCVMVEKVHLLQLIPKSREAHPASAYSDTTNQPVTLQQG